MNTDKLRFEINVAPANVERGDATPRRKAAGTAPPPIPEIARRPRTVVSTDATGTIHRIGVDAGGAGVDVDLSSMETALDAAATQLSRYTVSDLDALFSDEPGRELVDLVDRSHFQLAANEPTPLFQIDTILSDLDPDFKPS